MRQNRTRRNLHARAVRPGHHRHVTHVLRAEKGRSHTLERLHACRGGMPEGVALPGTGHRHLGIEVRRLLRRDRDLRPVVAHLEEVHVTHVTTGDDGTCLVLLGIAGKKPREGRTTLVVRERELDGVTVLPSTHLLSRRDDPEREGAHANHVTMAELLGAIPRKVIDRFGKLGGLVA